MDSKSQSRGNLLYFERVYLKASQEVSQQNALPPTRVRDFSLRTRGCDLSVLVIRGDPVSPRTATQSSTQDLSSVTGGAEEQKMLVGVLLGPVLQERNSRGGVHPQSFQWTDWDERPSRACKDGLEELWSEVWSLGALRCPSRSRCPAVQAGQSLGWSLASSRCPTGAWSAQQGASGHREQ